MSVIRDPDVYERFDRVTVVHSVRRVSDLAYRAVLEVGLQDDPLVEEQVREQLSYIPTVTREFFPTHARITTLVEQERLFKLNPVTDRVMLCGSMDMIRDCAVILEGLAFEEGSNAKPADFVIEKTFVG